MPDGPLPYPDVPAAPSLPALEEDILASWAAEGTFEASVAQRPSGPDGANEYVFYDGPPFANGLPHYGHLLTGFVKDAVPRYQTMRGHRVERRFGWDCHGLPAETEAEKELGVSGRGPITEYGIDRFNDYCRTSVLRYAHEWERYVTRQARWVDFKNDYKTMDLPYMESVMWALKQLWDKGLLYEGYRVLPYCWECETPLSNFETRQDDAYRDRQDPAVTVAFHLDGDPPVALWVWTTTPWTLPSNLAVAVGPEMDYAVFQRDQSRVALAEGTISSYDKQLAGFERIGTIKGTELVGRAYRPLFPYFADTPGAFRVLAADFVNTDEGTGVVHLAPGFGEDDQRACEASGIPVICPVDDRGRFTADVADYQHVQVFEANTAIIRDLRRRDVVVREDSYVHSYPHCWRTDTPLIYKAVSSWFVRVSAVKDRMLELNERIAWVPAHVRDGAFGKWLENARDWSISRNRFWGSPLPMWKSDDPDHPRLDVYGSLDELERDFGTRPADLHRPAIDDLVRSNPDDPTGRSMMRRVTDVLDCWFESGSMPFAQVHAPFAHEDWFEHHFPANFIVEYIGQTRGWFYTLHVLGTALFDRPPFLTCMAHGTLLGDDGQKMSKRLRNYPDPEAMFVKHGADAVRWFLLSSPVLRGGDMSVREQGIRDAVRSAIHPLWNAWYFFTLYANADGVLARPGRTDQAGVLDRYILAKLRGLVESVTTAMDSYDLSGACQAIEAFLDALTNWYIRRSRNRFWGTSATASRSEPSHSEAGQSEASQSEPSQSEPGQSEPSQSGPSQSGPTEGGRALDPGSGDQRDAFDTLATVLEVLGRTAAPLLPMVTESVWRGLTGGASVHLADWPKADALPADPDLVRVMDRVREVCSAAHSIRKARGLRARLPLASLTVAAADAAELAPFEELILDEVNVKALRLTTAVADVADQVLTVVFKVAAPRLGPATPRVAVAARSGDWEVLGADRARVGDMVLEAGEWDLRMTPRAPDLSRALPGNDGLVMLDVDVTPDLEAEGKARDVVRLVQQARRNLGLRVSDRIELLVAAAAELAAAIGAHQGWIAEQVLASAIGVRVGESSPGDRPPRDRPPGDGEAGWQAAGLPDGGQLWLHIRRADHGLPRRGDRVAEGAPWRGGDGHADVGVGVRGDPARDEPGR